MPYNSLTSRTDAAPLIPEERIDEIFQNIVTQSAVLSRARRLPNMTRAQTRLKVLDAMPVTYFVNGDTGLKQTSEQAWVNKYIDAEEIAVIIPIPENVLDDAEDDLWAEIQPRIQEAFAKKIDTAVLTDGDADAPSNWPDDLLTQITAASHTVDLSTTQAAGGDLYDALLGVGGVLSLVEADGYPNTGHVAVVDMMAQYRGLRDSIGQPIFKTTVTGGQNMQSMTVYELDGRPVFFSDNGAIAAATVLQFSGDWRQLVYSIRREITFKLFTEGVVTDSSGNIIYNLMQQDMIALRAVMRLGWQLPNPPTMLNTNSATRFPFAALVP